MTTDLASCTPAAVYPPAEVIQRREWSARVQLAAGVVVIHTLFDIGRRARAEVRQLMQDCAAHGHAPQYYEPYVIGHDCFVVTIEPGSVVAEGRVCWLQLSG